jgi:hypothetical protein
MQPPKTFEAPAGSLIGRRSAVSEAAYGSPDIVVTHGDPSPAEAAAVLAAVQVLLEAESALSAPELPWAYRSAWRRAAIDEGIRGADVS